MPSPRCRDSIRHRRLIRARRSRPTHGSWRSRRPVTFSSSDPRGSEPRGPVVLTRCPAGAVVSSRLRRQEPRMDPRVGRSGPKSHGLLYRTTTATGQFDPRLVSSAAPGAACSSSTRRTAGGSRSAGRSHDRRRLDVAPGRGADAARRWRPSSGRCSNHITVHGAPWSSSGQEPVRQPEPGVLPRESDGGATWTELTGRPQHRTTKRRCSKLSTRRTGGSGSASSCGSPTTVGNGGARVKLPGPEVGRSRSRRPTRLGDRTRARVRIHRRWRHVARDTPRTQPVWSSVLAPVPNGCPIAPVVDATPGKVDRAQASGAGGRRLRLAHARGWTGEDVLAVYPVIQPARGIRRAVSSNIPSTAARRSRR